MDYFHNFTRRRFIRIAGLVSGTAALSTLVACADNNSSPTPGSGQTPGGGQTTQVPSPTPQPAYTLAPGGSSIDSYLAVAPAVLVPGQRARVSVSLFSGSLLASDNVKVSLLENGKQLAEVSGQIKGRGELPLQIPKVNDGNYTLQLNTSNFTATSQIKVENATVLIIETDKPIYKPGQLVHLRALALDPQLMPVEEAVTLEVSDAKGTKIFRKNLRTDQYGMATVDMPLSNEPNLGVWKITGLLGKRKTTLDFRVEKYVLPKYEVKLKPAKEWALASEKITGTVSAEYSYGKPVSGELELKAYKYVGTWQEFASFTRNIDGQTSFELPAANYVAGVPASGGQGNVRIEAVVREKNTGYEESATSLLTISAAPLTLKVIPESVIFKPGLSASLLVIAQTPDKKPVDANVTINVTYSVGDTGTNTETRQVSVKQGLGTVQINPPGNAISLTLQASSGQAFTSLAMQAGYSPSGNFIHLQQVSKGGLKVGDTASFKISSTRQATGFYYEVLSRGTLVFTSYSQSPDISFTLTPQMAPMSRLLVYQILPNSEVAADYLPFSVEGSYQHKVEAAFSKAEVEPGQEVELNLKTDGPAKVGVAVVDRSVFILAENRLNLQQVFDELEKLYQKPQIELHDVQAANPMSGTINTFSSKEMFSNAGVLVMSNKTIPQGKTYNRPVQMFAGAPAGRAAATTAAATAAGVMDGAAKQAESNSSAGLAEVQRVRNFFPETWLWEDQITGADGKFTKKVNAPDSITTWMLNAVALSPQKGLGVTQAQLKVLQPFFVSVDLVYAAIRGEEFPVKVALYNYTATDEQFTVEIDQGNWFDLLEQSKKTITVKANDLGGVSFKIRARELGAQQVKITARSRNRADAVIKDLLVEPEGVARELVENLVISAGKSYELDMSLPQDIISGSARGFLALTGNYLTQTMEGLESLIKMPYGCGEQNMLLFAPNVYVSQYLRETNQSKPSIQAKAESLMVTGYQRELTYQRNDGSFSAFGNSDKIGSLWLSAFVLKTFAQAKNYIYVDDNVLTNTRNWITKQQKGDGSFEPVGFVHHQELLGGLKGNLSLTAYLAVALLESGDKSMAQKAVSYLEKALNDSFDSYSLAITAYALEMAKSQSAGKAYDLLVKKAKQDDNGTYWGDLPEVQPLNQSQNLVAKRGVIANRSAAIETTGYALMALTLHGDRIMASQAARWLVSKRNSYGGWDSTQDTVVGLQSLAQYVVGSKTDVEATVTFRDGSWQKELKLNADNADLLQTLQAPVGGKVSLEMNGKGQAVLQAVRRFNVPDPDRKDVSVFQVSVDYGVSQIALNNEITVKATVVFTPPEDVKAGMVVLDVALPTGFAPNTDSLANLQKQQGKLKRYEVAGRKVILYIEDMSPNEKLQFEFKALALYPIKAQAVTSQAYSYYNPAWKGESLGGAVTVTG
jgi:CD109 antigen